MNGTSLAEVKKESPNTVAVPSISVQIFNEKFEALLDTGASVSVISDCIYSNIKHLISDKIKEYNPVMHGVDGSVLRTIGALHLNIVINNVLFQHEFVIVNKLVPKLILGQDFLFSHGAIIDFNSKCVHFGKSTIKFISKDTKCHDTNSLVVQIDKSNRKGENGVHLTTSDYIYFSETKLSLNESLKECFQIKENDSKENEFNIDVELTNKKREKLNSLLNKYKKQFAFDVGNLGSCNMTEVEIRTTDEIPVHRPPYRVSHEQHKIIREQIDEMLKHNIIRESNSAYASPVVLVKKPDNTWRFCVDYRKLNKKVITDSYPLPVIDDIILYLSKARYFADLDLNSGYWQLRLRDKHKSAFITPSGLYEFNVLPFGLKTSGSVFQRTMDRLIGGLKYKNAIVYIDNIIVYSQTFEEFCDVLEQVLCRIKEANLTLKPSKCKFGYRKISVLGYDISGDGIRPDSSKLDKINNIKIPTSIKELKSILGLFSYYRKFIDNYANLALPLSKLMKKGSKFYWGEPQQIAFDQILTLIRNPPLLRHFTNDEGILTRLYVDASDNALGACLMQGNDSLLPISFASRRLSDCERKYTITEKECLALVWALNYFKHLLWGMDFEVVTDHKALVWLRERKDMTGRLARWALAIQEYDFKIVHCSGRENVIADFLSRNPLCERGDKVEDGDKIVNEGIVDDGLQLYALDVNRLADEQRNDDFCNLQRNKVNNSRHHRYKGFFLRNERLFHRYKINGRMYERIVIPQCLFDDVMKEIHDDAWTGAHFGLTKTLSKFRERFYINNSERKICKYIESCVVCQERKKADLIAPLQPIQVNRLFDKIALDILGPFTKSTGGNKYVIVCMEYLSKYAICKAIPRATAEAVSDFLTQEVFCKFGLVRQVISDRGSIFTSQIVRRTINFFGSTLEVATTRHPQTIGLVERFNRTLIQGLAMYVNRDQRDWCSYLPMITYAYNITKQSSTNLAPYTILFAREPEIRSDPDLGINSVGNHLDLAARRETNENNIAKAIRNIRGAQERQKRNYDKKVKFKDFSRGQLVLVYNPKRVTGVGSKLSRLYKGPYKIIRQLNNNNFLLKRLGQTGGHKMIAHHNSLKPFALRIV